MKNAYEIRGDTTVIFIKRRNGDVHECFVDTEDLPRLIEDGGSWCVDIPYNHKDPSRKPYAIRNAAKPGGGRQFIKMHRLLTDAPRNTVVDHINGSTLDNRKSNLKVTDNFGNAQNVREPSRNNKSGVLNVHFNKHDQIWIASMMRYGRVYKAKRKDFNEAIKIAEQMRAGTWNPTRRRKRQCS